MQYLMNWKKGMVAMNEYRITLTPRAKDDLIDIGDYITFILLESDIARNYIKGLRNSISQLKIYPCKFPLVQDDILQSQVVRCMPYKNHYVFYEVIDMLQVVIVLRIGYNKRNWKDILN